MKIAVVIATHGRNALLERTLRSVGACDDPGAALEIIVVENGGSPDADRLCASLSLPYPLRYIFVPEPGKSNALNVAFRQTDADLIVLFDDDVRMPPGTVAAYAEAACRLGRGHFFGGPFDIDYEAPPPAWLRPYLPASAVGWSLGAHERVIRTPDFIGVNYAVFREDVLEAGGFATHLGPNATFRTIGQETDMQRRLLKRGLGGVYLPGAHVWHFVPRQRCSTRWALDRCYRASLSRVLARARRSYGRGALLGVPLWLWKQCIRSALRVALVRLLGRDWPNRIQDEMRLARDIGAVRGYRLATGSHPVSVLSLNPR